MAIELGSSKVTGIAGKKNLDGSITVLAVTTEKSSAFIRKGVVYNIDKSAQCIVGIVKKLEATLKTHISQVFVGVGGQSIRSHKNTIVKEFNVPTKVTNDMVNALMDSNRNMDYPEQEILDAAVQEYKVDNHYQPDPVGIECQRLEGNFLNILERKNFYSSLNKCFRTAGIEVAEMYLAPFALADSVLTEGEKRAGCALVDIGADTTTVSVYFRNILRHLAVIPIGSANITKDIASELKMEEEDAEKMKLKYGCAYTEPHEISETTKYSIDKDRSVAASVFAEIVECRMEEIIRNAGAQIQASDYTDKLIAGVVLTGGGSNMKDTEKAFTKYVGVEKIRTAKFVQHSIDSNSPLITNHNGTMNTVLALLAKGEINCAGSELDTQGNLFPQEDEGQQEAPTAQQPREPKTPGKGVVMTEAEKKAAEEEKRKKEEEEERIRKEQEEKEQEKQKTKGPSFFKRMGNKFTEFIGTIVKEEDEDNGSR